MTTMTPEQVARTLDTIESPDGSVPRRPGSGGRWMVVHGGLAIVVIVLLTVLTAVGAGERALDLRRVTLQDAVLGEELQAAYTSLSQADNAVATSFLLGPQPSPLGNSLDSDYQRAITLARAKVDSAVLGTGGDPRAVRASAVLSVYREQVAAARALSESNSAQAPVVQREATATMRSDLLPLIDGQGSLLADVRARSAASVSDASAFPWWTLGLTVLAVLLLARTQRLLAARTRRRLNAGLLVATLAVAVSGAGSAEAVRAVRGHVVAAAAAVDASRLCSQLANGARRAHSAETLWTARLNSDPQAQETVLRELGGLRGSTGVAPTTCGPVGPDVDTWERSLGDRTDPQKAQADGSAAVEVVAGDRPGSSGAAFHRIVGETDEATGVAQDRIQGALSAAEAGPSRLLPISIVAGVLALGGVLVGLWQRVREYS